jgi:PilZ domain-containing protein
MEIMSSTTQAEKRLARRAKMSKMVRVRPSGPDDEHFEELPITVNVSKHGIYFHTHRTDYRKGMRLFITYPFTFANDPMKTEYLAEVVRVEDLADKRVGVAVRLLMTI